MRRLLLVISALAATLPAEARGPNSGPSYNYPQNSRPAILGQALEHSYGGYQVHRQTQEFWGNQRQNWQQQEAAAARRFQQLNEDRFNYEQRQQMQRQHQEFTQRHGYANSTPGIGNAPPPWSNQRHEQQIQREYRLHQDRQELLQNRGVAPLPSPYYAPPQRLCTNGYTTFAC